MSLTICEGGFRMKGWVLRSKVDSSYYSDSLERYGDLNQATVYPTIKKAFEAGDINDDIVKVNILIVETGISEYSILQGELMEQGKEYIKKLINIKESPENA